MKKIVYILLTVILIASTASIGWVTYGYRDWDTSNWRYNIKQSELPKASAIDGEGNELLSGVIHAMPEELLFMSSGENNESVSVTLNATVLPKTAKNKSVDWSVIWRKSNLGFAVGKIVTDYVTVTPIVDGSTTAVVTCLQPFADYIDIVVTTREGKFTAKCTVSFIGKPESIVITSNDLSFVGDKADFAEGVEYRLDIALDNAWSTVGEQFKDFAYSVSIDAYMSGCTRYINPQQPSLEIPDVPSGSTLSSDRYYGYKSFDGFALKDNPAVFQLSLVNSTLVFKLDADFYQKIFSSIESFGVDGDGLISLYDAVYSTTLPVFRITVWQKENPELRTTITLYNSDKAVNNVLIDPNSIEY